MKKMSKLLALMLAMCLVFCACGEKKEEETSAATYSEYENFDYSAGLDEKGYFEGVKATDYVTLPSLDKIVVTRAELDAQIESVMSSESYMRTIYNTDASLTVADGDTIGIDYVGSIDGVEFDGGSTSGMGTEVTIGVTSYIDDFLYQLIGHHPGETVNVEVTFPDDYGNEELNGKDALFVTKINYIAQSERNELNDEFVKEYFEEESGWTTVAEFEQGCAELVAENNFFSSCTFADSLPESVGDAYVGRMLSDIYKAAAQYNIDVDTYVSYVFSSYGITQFAQVKTAYEAYKTVMAKEFLVNQALSETVGFTVSDAELQEYYVNCGIEEANVKTVEETYGIPYLTSMALYDKALEFVHSLVVVE